jgi:hypothetical protein
LINSQTYLDKGIKVTDYGRVEIEGSLYVKQTVPVTNLPRPVSIFPSFQEVTSTGNNWVSLENVISGICIKMVGAGGGGGSRIGNQGSVGGGGGSGSYAEVYITKDELDRQDASYIYFLIGSGGSKGTGGGDSSNIGTSNTQGSNGGSSSCKISKGSGDTTGSNIFTVNPGDGGNGAMKEGGSSNGDGAGGGSGGTKGSILIGSGYCLQGEPGENGVSLKSGSYSFVSGKRGGQSKLGSAGAGQTVYTSAIDGVNGGGGGSGCYVNSSYFYDGTNGGNAYAIVYIY